MGKILVFFIFAYAHTFTRWVQKVLRQAVFRKAKLINGN